MSTAKNVKATLTGMKGHLTRQIKNCEDLSNQTPVNYEELEGYYKVAQTKYQHVLKKILKYQDILATPNINEEAMDDVIQENADYEDEMHANGNKEVGTYAVGPSKPTVNASPKSVTPQDAVNVWKPCVFCEQPHVIYFCKFYPDRATRIKRLKELRKCTKFIRAHNPDTCTTHIRTCNRCHKGQHHTALCGDSSTKSAKPQKEEGTTTSVQLCTVLLGISVFSTRSDHKSALLTAQLTIKNGESKATICGLFDQGSQMAFISKELVDALKLTPVRETRIDIAGFLTNTGARVLKVVRPKVRLGGYVRTIQALVVDRFPTDLYVYGLGTTVKFLKEKGIHLADKITSDNLSNIGILMGLDVYHTFIKGKEEKQGMSLLPSAGGYLLTGPVLRLKQPAPVDRQLANPVMVA
ncbi:uncharacterized protein [Procambarus clarkii]|uniref:uncharacterized protein n=1 Tax=Procambarus clarkii TaxID=6728 RepID=UPI00374220CB